MEDHPRTNHAPALARPARARHAGLVVALLLVVGVSACEGGPFASNEPEPAAPTGLLEGDGEVGATDLPVSPVAVPPLHPSVDDWPAGQVVVDPGDGAAPLAVAVRIADTSERRSHGLMEVEEVPDGVGMWFVYDEDSDGAYWMQGTLTNLDIAWVDDRGRIVATETMVVCEEDPCPRYDPQTSYRTALEVRAGWLADHDVEVGDRILRGSSGG